MSLKYTMTKHTVELIDALAHNDDVDTTINCRDGVVVQAHSYILKMRSPVFRAMFMSGMREAQGNVINLLTFSDECVINAVQYMKSSLVKTKYGKLKLSVVFELLEFSDQYELNTFHESIIEYLNDQADTIVGAISLLHYCQDGEIAKRALKTISITLDDSKYERSKLNIHGYGEVEDKVKIMIFDYIMKDKFTVTE